FSKQCGNSISVSGFAVFTLAEIFNFTVFTKRYFCRIKAARIPAPVAFSAITYCFHFLAGVMP
ncbi:hypothetical protein P9477_24140, partial [Enterobacter mori]|uniref:hypothetical protein n=1 Tax=Enterobacter mori TaxID=539813 RepID=UPI00398AC9A1